MKFPNKILHEYHRFIHAISCNQTGGPSARARGRAANKGRNITCQILTSQQSCHDIKAGRLAETEKQDKYIYIYKT